MGKQGHGAYGNSKGKTKTKDRGFGKALIRQQELGVQGMNGLNYYKDAEKQKSMLSNLDGTDLNDFVDGMEMSGQTPDVHRVKSDADAAFLLEGTEVGTTLQSLTTDEFDYTHLPVPRKPRWSKDMTAEEVDFNEREAFLNWRRKIAIMEESNREGPTAAVRRATPFEKNLEVWRQLWRVLEKSDMGVQIVDARNPLLYYTGDLLKYASEKDCPSMLLVNKADFLTESQRKAWAEQLDAMGIKFAFYSAGAEQKKIDLEAQLNSTASGIGAFHGMKAQALELAQAQSDLLACDESEVEMLADDLCDRFAESKIKGGQNKEKDTHGVTFEDEAGIMDSKMAGLTLVSDANKEVSNPNGVPESAQRRMERSEILRRRCRVLTRTELILLLQLLPLRLDIIPQDRHGGRVCVGMVGFPNVGKSSCINSILGVSKSTHGVTRVAVSSTPGKTKHFQTLMVNDNLMLCDCPGLVFPSFMRSTGEMLCSGILPINQMKGYEDAASVIASRVPSHLIEAAYGIKIRRELDIKDNPDRPPTCHEMLCAYCALKGYITNGTGRWDEFRAAKEMVKDFCDGVLLFVSPPAKYSREHGAVTITEDGFLGTGMRRWLTETENTMMRREKVADRVAAQRLAEIEEEEAIAEWEAEQAAARGISTGPVRDTYTTASGQKVHTELVFGDGKYDNYDNAFEAATEATAAAIAIATSVVTAGGEGALTTNAADGGSSTEPATSVFTFDDESSDEEGNYGEDEEDEKMGAHGKVKREHKKLQHWGKKNRKNRDKTPYGEDNGVVSYSAYSTSRGLAGAAPASKARALGDRKTLRDGPTEFKRATNLRGALPKRESS